MSVSEAKSSITATEFVRWLTRIEESRHERTPDQYHLAQITFWIYQLFYIVLNFLGGRLDNRRSVEEFLIKFVTEDKAPTPSDNIMSEAVETQAAKDRWMAFAGVGEKEIRTRRPPERN